MRSLETAADQAINWHTLPLTDDEAEVARVMQICNACRYCEGYCAVFPAMTRRLTFDNKADLNYLANLCHNCTACLHACQYAPPHEFAVNVPKAMAKVRKDTYSEYAWPSGLGKLYKRNGLILSLVVALALVLFLVMAAGTAGGLDHGPLNGDFYAIFPHNTLVLMFGTVFLYAVFALFWSTRRFWKDISPGRPTEPAIMETTRDALTMKYLDGGHGMGCNDEDDKFTLRRRIFHHFTFYGFALCFAATSVGTIYHYVFGWYAPYDYFSLPVILGTLGGIGLVIGPVGLFWLNRVRASQASDPEQAGMDLGFIALLFLISVTGLILLVLRDTGQMGLWLAIHLGFVMGFFLMMPYSKFAHGFYRVAALLKYAIERRQPNKAGLPD